MLQQYKGILIALLLVGISGSLLYGGYTWGVRSERLAQAERDEQLRKDLKDREDRLTRVEQKAAELLARDPEKEAKLTKEVIRYEIHYRDRSVDTAERDAERLRILNEAYGVGESGELPDGADDPTGKDAKGGSWGKPR